MPCNHSRLTNQMSLYQGHEEYVVYDTEQTDSTSKFIIQLHVPTICI